MNYARAMAPVLYFRVVVDDWGVSVQQLGWSLNTSSVVSWWEKEGCLYCLEWNMDWNDGMDPWNGTMEYIT